MVKLVEVNLYKAHVYGIVFNDNGDYNPTT